MPRTHPAGPSLSFGSNTATNADTPTTDSVVTSVETLPLSTSQTSTTSGATKRVLSHGQHVVLNSDSDSDSMAELDFGLPAPKTKIPTQTGRSTRRTGFDEQELRRPPKKGSKSVKRPFSQLIEAAQKNMDAEREIQERKADLERVEEQTAPVATTLDKDTLEQAINDAEDPDQADRLFKAMQRTNQVRVQAAYHFFGDTHHLSLTSPFPQQSLPDQGWTACFEVPSSRDQAFMTGFAHQIFRFTQLPKELAAWMIDQNAMEAVICQYADNHKLTSGVGSPPPDVIHSLITSQLVHIIPNLLSRVTNPLLQVNLVHAFPTKSPLTAYLQRHLALSFLFYPTSVDVPLADPQLPNLIHAHLETSPHYRMNKGTDYSFLTARLALLDIAIGPGPLDVPYLPLVSPPPSEAGSSPFLAPTPGSSEVKEFNRAVDTLAQHIKLLGNSIVETGAALDLTILEAKERCERIYWRLQHAVRVGGKKADNVFGDDDEEGQTKIRSFLKPLPKKITSKVEDSIFDREGDIELPA
ncbi:hypothetical protein N0V95_000845 [Ascochyta clinopodiicola]|nr:hypothetical protein N0V95_000845 [Ascochyta clinopodiicola]